MESLFIFRDSGRSTLTHRKAVQGRAWNAHRPVNSHSLPSGCKEPHFLLLHLTVITLVCRECLTQKVKCIRHLLLEAVFPLAHPLLGRKLESSTFFSQCLHSLSVPQTVAYVYVVRFISV